MPAPCSSPGRTLLLLKNDSDNHKDKLIWKWLRGSATTAEFGNPTTTSGYALCLWNAGRLVMGELVDPAGTCGTTARWKPLGSGPSGFKYRNSATNPDRIFSVLLKQGTGNAKVLLKGKSMSLSLPEPVSATEYFTPGNVTVQLIRTDAPGCWQGVYTSSRTNAPTKFLSVED